MDFITKALADDFSVDELIMDFAKSFDSVCIRRLCLKLECLGIRNKNLLWCQSFLTNRVQRVVVGEIFSDWENVESGVPQGSVLGPLLFVIFINDLLKKINNEGKLFADDTKILSIIKSESDNVKLQEDFNLLYNWSSDWKITVTTL